VVTATELVIVRHELERWKNSNTARLAAMALPRARLIDHPGPTPALPEGTWLLYPGPEAAPPIAPPRCLVVLDGSWGQTRRMTQRLPWLRGLPRLSLPAPVDKLPRLRAQRLEDGMSTLEAILRAVALLEGQAMADPLVGLLRVACQRHSMQPIADAS
jgi:DTW domain-containing protein YfiP